MLLAKMVEKVEKTFFRKILANLGLVLTFTTSKKVGIFD